MEDNKEKVTPTTENEGEKKTDTVVKEELKKEEPKKEKLYTREEVEKIKKAEREALLREQEEKRTEAEKLAKMDAEEKAKYQLEKERKEKEEALAKLNAYELKETATKIASEKGLDITLLDVIDYSKETAESIKDKIEKIDIAFKKAVENGINAKLQEKSPKQVVPNGNKNVTDQEYLKNKYKNNPYLKIK